MVGCSPMSPCLMAEMQAEHCTCLLWPLSLPLPFCLKEPLARYLSLSPPLSFFSLTSLCLYKHKKTNHLSHSTVFIMSGRNTSNTWQQDEKQHKAEHRTKAKLVKGRKPFEFRGVTNYHVRKKHGATRSNTWQQDENNTKRNTEPSKASKKNLPHHFQW